MTDTVRFRACELPYRNGTGHAMFDRGHAMDEVICGRAAVFVLVRIIDKIVSAKPAFRLDARRRSLRHNGCDALLLALRRCTLVVCRTYLLCLDA